MASGAIQLRNEVLRNRQRLIEREGRVVAATRSTLEAMYRQWIAELRRAARTGGRKLSATTLADIARHADLLRRAGRITEREFQNAQASLRPTLAEVYRQESYRARYVLDRRIAEGKASFGASFRGVNERAADAAATQSIPGVTGAGLVSRRAQATMKVILTKAVANDWKVDKVAEEWMKVAGRLVENEAATLARTALMQASNNAAIAEYARHPQIISGVRWEATFDSRTCPTCAGLHGRFFLINKAPAMPAHYNCRCVWIPVFVGDEAEAFSRLGAFRTSGGSIAYRRADRSFDGWLSRQSVGTQRDFFPSETKWKAWDRNLLGIEDMTHLDGTNLTDREILRIPGLAAMLQ